MGILSGSGCCIWFYVTCKKKGPSEIFGSMPPILGKYTDGILGRLIDLLAVFALLAGTATTFSLATPLMASVIGELFPRRTEPYRCYDHHPGTYLRGIHLLFATWFQRESASLPSPAFISSSDCWRMCSCSEARPNTSSRPDSLPSDVSHRTFSNLQLTQTHNGQPRFHRLGRSSTGLTGWYGV